MKCYDKNVWRIPAWVIGALLALLVGLGAGRALGEAPALPTRVVTSTYLGSSGDRDEVVAVRIASDGTLVVAANLGDANPGAQGVAPVDLPGFAVPQAPPPRLEAFEDFESYLAAAERWIEANVPAAPPPPTLASLTAAHEAEDDEAPATPLTEQQAQQKLPGARRAYVEQWLGGWAGGAVLRLSEDGRRVLSVLRVGPRVEDMALDAQDRIYLAAGPSGFYRIERDGVTVSDGFPKLAGRDVRRIDAGGEGFAVTLSGNRTGDVILWGPDGAAMHEGRGHRRTADVALSVEHRMLFHIGYTVTRTWAQDRGGWSNFPVHIAHLAGRTFDGQDAWLAYGWERHLVKRDAVLNQSPTDWVIEHHLDRDPAAFENQRQREQFIKDHLGEIHRFPSLHPEVNPRWINRSNNNMADTRGCRVEVGHDGQLYAAFEAAGGNHIFRYDPFDITAPVRDLMPRVDEYHEMANTRSSHKGVVGRYDPKTGRVLRVQQFNTVIEQKRVPVANAFRLAEGGIAADEAGRLYVAAAAASGLPIRFAKRFGNRENPPNFNPFGRDAASSGAALMIMSPELDQRLFTTRLSESGGSRAVDARVIDGRLRVVWAGQAGLRSPTYLRNALQPEPGWGEADGFLAMLGHETTQSTAAAQHPIHLIGDEPLQPIDTAPMPRAITDADVDGDGKPDAQSVAPLAPRFISAQGHPLHVGWRTQAGQLDQSPDRFELDGQVTATDEATLYRSKPLRPHLRVEGRHRYWAVIHGPVSGAGQRLSIGAGSDLTLPGNGLRMSQARLLVRDGERWFVSQQNMTDDATLFATIDSDDGRWAPIDPAAVIEASDPPDLLTPPATDGEVDDAESDAAAPDDRYQTMNFRDITAVGVLLFDDWRDDGRAFTFDDLTGRLAVDLQDNPAPIAAGKVAPSLAPRFAPVRFDAGDSRDPQGRVSFYSWRLGRERQVAGPRVEHRFVNAGRHPVTLTVWDDQGAADQTQLHVDIGLEGLTPTDGLTTVAAWGGELHSRIGFGYSRGEQWHHRKLDERSFFGEHGDRWGAWLIGGASVPAPPKGAGFGDFSARNRGTSLRPLSQFETAVRGEGAAVLVAVPQAAFLSDAHAGGADLSRGQLYAGQVRVERGTTHWVIRTPDGWRVSRAPATRVEGGRFGDELRDDFASIQWMAYDPEAGPDLRPDPKARPTPERGAVVTAVGILCLADGGRIAFSTLGATGVPAR